ncbi:MAG TPA: hypothetical protein VF292_00385 [Rhodanobacteraceae bacterium]
MSAFNLPETLVDIRQYPNPNPESLPEKQRAEYARRRAALTDVLGGSTIRSAAKQHHVNRSTLADDRQKFHALGPDGKPLGFRACIPWRFRKESPDRPPTQVPTKKAPGAFTRLVAATPGAQDAIDRFAAPLPTGKRKNTKFDALHRTILALVTKVHGKDGYPFDTPDRGRRALLAYIKRARKTRQCAKAAAVEGTSPRIMRLSQIFQLNPLDRVEYDAHTIDVDMRLKVPAPDGGHVLRAIKQVTLLAAICPVSRYLLGYILKFGAYNEIDVLRLFHKVLLPWQPRQLIVPGMAYAPGAVLGLPAACDGRALRAVVSAGDNAFAHHAKAVRGNLLRHHRGVLHFGPAHVPEVRPMIEAFFRRIEQGALRSIAGGFHPGSRSGDPRSASTLLSADDHPLHWEGMYDLMDVLASGHNVTPHSGLHERLPVDALRDYLASGAWAFEVADPVADARQLLTVRVHPVVRGNKKAGKVPYIEWQGARYRSPKLDCSWSQVGVPQNADVYLEDVRTMVLLDTDGTVWSKLTAMSPWDRTPHDLALRQKVNSARHRGLIRIVGGDDAIDAYNRFVMAEAAAGNRSAEQYGQLAYGATGVATTPKPVSHPRLDVAPRAGRFSFERTKD